MGGAFSDGDVDRHQLLASHVVPAFRPRDGIEWQLRSYNYSRGSVQAAVMQPMADYVDVKVETPFPAYQRGSKVAMPGPARPSTMPEWPEVNRGGDSPIEWRRQALFVKSTDAGTPEYVVLRDTVVSREPSMWLFWTLTRGLVETGGSPLKDGATSRPTRPLSGNRFTGRGQWGVDLEYFVAEPQGTPRHTLRWGKSQGNPPPAVDEYQDLLHLQLPGPGAYFVVLYPRATTTPAPSFEMLAPSVVRIRDAWGEDVVVMGDDKVRSTRDGITIEARVGVVRRLPDKDIICLPAGGRCQTPRLDVKDSGPTTKIGQ